MPTTEVILTEKIASLGAEADVIKVKRGYARNFLIPFGKALEVTPITLRRLNQLKTKRAEREGRELNESEDLARRINKLKLTITIETGATGKAFGSVTAKDIAEKLKAELGVEIDRHRIELEHSIKDTGIHEIPVKLHADVVATLILTIKSSVEEGAETAAAADSEAPTEKGGFKAKVKAKHSK
jgi:large subunit ribosomal protein L9